VCVWGGGGEGGGSGGGWGGGVWGGVGTWLARGVAAQKYRSQHCRTHTILLPLLPASH